uniref:IF rod domain-containing protein n=1 Tax=Zonotrichia albicollis TaxID=44394 RepID=A0A8D2MDD9_ZONAL
MAQGSRFCVALQGWCRGPGFVWDCRDGAGVPLPPAHPRCAPVGFGGFAGGGAAFSGGSFGSGGFQGGNVGILSYDEKLTMQSLNERLASYMETVRNLEKENAHLEQLIREWYQKQGPIGPKDYSHYYEKIEELQKQVGSVETHKVLLELDNTKMTAEDFRIKYEMESGLRQNVEGDLNSLRPMLDNLTLAKSDLEMQFESLKEEIIDLKKSHEEEMKQLQSQSNGDVNVQINTAPGEDLLKKLNEMRQEYEAIIQKNRAEVEKWYEMSQQVHSSSQQIESSNQQISVLRREFQSLEIELQSQISQSNLDDTERRYNMQLQQIQSMIGPLEEELASIRCEMESQNEEYKMLLGIKTRLEQEIQQYRALLHEGQQGIRYRQQLINFLSMPSGKEDSSNVCIRNWCKGLIINIFTTSTRIHMESKS